MTVNDLIVLLQRKVSLGFGDADLFVDYPESNVDEIIVDIEVDPVLTLYAVKPNGELMSDAVLPLGNPYCDCSSEVCE